MPKHNIMVEPGSKLPSAYEQLIKSLFKEKDLVKLEKFGGRIQVSITAPFTDRKSQKLLIELTDAFIEELKQKPDDAKLKIEHFTKKQLLLLAQKLNLPMASARTTKAVQNAIIQYLQTPEHWKGIAGEKNSGSISE